MRRRVKVQGQNRPVLLGRCNPGKGPPLLLGRRVTPSAAGLAAAVACRLLLWDCHQWINTARVTFDPPCAVSRPPPGNERDGCTHRARHRDGAEGAAAGRCVGSPPSSAAARLHPRRSVAGAAGRRRGERGGSAAVPRDTLPGPGTALPGGAAPARRGGRPPTWALLPGLPAPPLPALRSLPLRDCGEPGEGGADTMARVLSRDPVDIEVPTRPAGTCGCR